MKYKLVIAEKPSVAKSIAKVIGAAERKDGYLEGGGYIVSWCVGHLVELSAPEAYDETYAKWRLSDLPILPTNWRYQVSASTKKQFNILKDLMNRDDVESLVCATDAGREGELIFRLVYHQAGCKKSFERLWISSMEDQSIRDGFANLEPSTQYDALYEAALCRERADWIVGMNATRLFSCLYRQTLNIGRVMTPTLAMVVMRDAAIAAFKPQPFYTVQLDLNGITADSKRFDAKEDALQLLAKCRESGKVMIKSMDRKEKTEHAPLLYDLTALQRDANRILGFTAQQTLDYTQALYEKKLVTYPRTDSRYLTEDMKPMLPSLLTQVAAKIGISTSALKAADQSEIIADALCNSSKVSDHHAIIPTKTMSATEIAELPSGEKSILQLIAVRLLCAAAPAHRFAEDNIILSCGDEEFSRKIKTEIFGGWKVIRQHFYPAREQENDGCTDKALSPNMEIPLSNAEIKEGKTTAPKHFTEDTLLSSMETAGAEDIPEEAERRGLGTPATRAGIIEKLVQKGFIERKGDKKTRYLISTNKGISLITVMPEQIRSAAMTADWEQKLLCIEHGDYEANAFMREIKEMISGLVQNYEAVKEAENLMSDYKRVGACPHCQADVLEKQKGWFCSNAECRFVLWKDNAFFNTIGKRLSSGMVEKMLADGRIYLKDCRSQRSGKNYNATLILSTEESGKASFNLEFENRRSAKGGKH